MSTNDFIQTGRNRFCTRDGRVFLVLAPARRGFVSWQVSQDGVFVRAFWSWNAAVRFAGTIARG